MESPIESLFIVGAGFSSNAGLPLASEFTKELLDVERLKGNSLSTILAKFVSHFVADVFGNGVLNNHNDWPSLEDLFTIIDLTANTGHSLGRNYPASELRTVRRALIVRLMRMLSNSLLRNQKKPSNQYRLLVEFLENVDTDNSAFLSMNWDVVIENILTTNQKKYDIEYGCNATAARFTRGVARLRRGRPPQNSFTILKPHGSVNWMYCDTCSRIFWFPPDQTTTIASRLFKGNDRNTVRKLLGEDIRKDIKPASCPACGARSLGTRLATFSYRKALEFPMHQATWSRAEDLLREARNWVFVGYSLPAADYQFKHMLKKTQLARQKNPKIILITKDPSEETIRNYQRFFGRSALPDSSVFNNGISDEAIIALKKKGVFQ